MPRYPLVPRHIHESLRGIEPTQDGELTYFPCSITLTSGEVLDTVYFMPERPIRKLWEAYLQSDGAKRLIRLEDVAEVRDSPTRLPARFANELYQHGETGMGYTIFTVVFSDGTRQACVTSSSVDFIQYPHGKSLLDVTAVVPNEGREDKLLVKAPPGWFSKGTNAPGNFSCYKHHHSSCQRQSHLYRRLQRRWQAGHGLSLIRLQRTGNGSTRVRGF